MTKFHIPEFYVQTRKFKTPVFSFAKKHTAPSAEITCCVVPYMDGPPTKHSFSAGST